MNLYYYRTSIPQQSLNDNFNTAPSSYVMNEFESKCCDDNRDSDIYVDVTDNYDPVYEHIPLQSLNGSNESMVKCSDTESVDYLVENPTYEACPNVNSEDDNDVAENMYATIPCHTVLT